VAVKVVNEKVETSILSQRINDFKLLIKLRLTLTVVFSSIMAFLIASNGSFQLVDLFVLALGGFLVTSAANIFNQVLEKDYDKLMIRTANRPIASGRMTVSEAVLTAGFFSLIGITLLALFNPWASFLGMLSMVLYAFVYTPMKRISPAAVAVGAIPGALPTLIGCVAAQGELTLLGFVLFALQFCWQFPHFWSIGWLGFEDYKKAGYKLMPQTDEKPDRSIGLQSVMYTIMLYPIVGMLYYNGISGPLSLALILILTVSYSYFAWNFYNGMDRKSALRLMFFSFLYIPVTLIVLFIDTMLT